MFFNKLASHLGVMFPGGYTVRHTCQASRSYSKPHQDINVCTVWNITMCFREEMYFSLKHLNHTASLAILLLLCRINVSLSFRNVFSKHMWKDSIGSDVWLTLFHLVPNVVYKHFLLFISLGYNEHHKDWHLLKLLWKIFERRVFIMTRLSGIISHLIHTVNQRKRIMNTKHTLNIQ